MKHRLLLSGKFNPQFIPCGIALDHIQLAMFNVIGRGSKSRRGAIVEWFKEYKRLRRKI